jgi:hypothetical protein
MKKNKLNVVIHKTGTANNNLLDSIGNYNEGKIDFSPRDLEGWFTVEKAYLPTTRKDHCLIKDETEPNLYHVSEDGGKSYTLSIEWVEVYEIQSEPATADDLKDIFN